MRVIQVFLLVKLCRQFERMLSRRFAISYRKTNLGELTLDACTVDFFLASSSGQRVSAADVCLPVDPCSVGDDADGAALASTDQQKPHQSSLRLVINVLFLIQGTCLRTEVLSGEACLIVLNLSPNLCNGVLWCPTSDDELVAATQRQVLKRRN